MLGLRYGSVRLVEHDAGWRRAFLRARALLVQALRGVGAEVEHIGSTAVPGLPAKPILDIAVGIPQSVDVSGCIMRLQQHGFDYRGDAGDGGGHVFVRAKADVRTHHVHLVALGGRQWRAYLTLRDLLRQDAEARDGYAAVKRDLALRFPEDRKSYTNAKDAIVEQLVGRAVASTPPHNLATS